MFCLKSKPDWLSELGWIFSARINVEEYKSYGIRGHFLKEMGTTTVFVFNNPVKITLDLLYT